MCFPWLLSFSDVFLICSTVMLLPSILDALTEGLFHSTFLPSWRTLAAPMEASDGGNAVSVHGGNAGSVHGGNAGSVHSTPSSF